MLRYVLIDGHGQVAPRIRLIGPRAARLLHEVVELILQGDLQADSQKELERFRVRFRVSNRSLT